MGAPKYQLGDRITTGTLYRRIYPDNASFQNGKTTSQCFRPKRNDPGLSAHLAELTSPEEVLAGHPDYGLAEITVGAALTAGFSIIFDPKEGEPGHVLICGEFPPTKSRELSRLSRVLIAPKIR